jgi:hypothetical protein
LYRYTAGAEDAGTVPGADYDPMQSESPGGGGKKDTDTPMSMRAFDEDFEAAAAAATDDDDDDDGGGDPMMKALAEEKRGGGLYTLNPVVTHP